jgi:hypothetical protein
LRFRDFLDRLSGNPGWHRDHEKAWSGLTTIGPNRLSPFQERLHARIAEIVAATNYTLTPWRFESDKHITCTADIREIGLCIWTDPDSASFGRTMNKRHAVPEVVFEEWEYKLPEDFINHFATELQTALQEGAA